MEKALVLLAVERDSVRTLLRSLPPSRARRVLQSIREIPAALVDTPAHAIVCDLNGVAETVAKPLIAQAESQGTQVVVASELTARAAELVLHSANRGLTDVLLCDCEADLRHVAHRLSLPSAGCTLALRLLASMRPRVLRLPRPLRNALVGVASARCYAGLSAGGFARRAGVSRRSAARWLSAVGLAAPRTLLAAFRLAHLWPVLSSSTLAMPVVADGGGYGSDRTLRAHCEKVLGWSPSQIRRFRSDAEMLDGLAKAVGRASTDTAPVRDDDIHACLDLERQP